MTINYVRIKRFCELCGYPEGAIRAKIAEGKWLNGSEYVKASDGRILISLSGFEKWVEKSKVNIPVEFQ